MNTVLLLFEAANSPKALIEGEAHHATCCLDNMKWAFKGLLSR